MRGKPGYEHLNEPLHILVEAELPAEIIDARLMQAREILEDLLRPVVCFCEFSMRLDSLIGKLFDLIVWIIVLSFRKNPMISTRSSSFVNLQWSMALFARRVPPCLVLFRPSTTALVWKGPKQGAKFPLRGEWEDFGDCVNFLQKHLPLSQVMLSTNALNCDRGTGTIGSVLCAVCLHSGLKMVAHSTV